MGWIIMACGVIFGFSIMLGFKLYMAYKREKLKRKLKDLFLKMLMDDIEKKIEEEKRGYEISIENGVISAKNIKTGQIEFRGTDASTIIQSAIDALSNGGGKIFIKSGTYILSSPIRLNKNIRLFSMGETISKEVIKNEA
jgi:hypothetical protein